MSKNGAGFDPAIEDVGIGNDEGSTDVPEKCGHLSIDVDEDDGKTACLDCGEVL